jgi:cytochrome c nitrite reductase small subunit
MRPQYATWQRGSHGRVATCNDCHVPHDNIFKTYAFKAMDGTRHSWMFTFRLEPQVIRMHEPGVRVVQDNCIRCHADAMGDAVHTLAIAARDARAGRGKLCWECHRETPHGRVKSLTSTPDAQVPLLDNVLPPWLQPLRKDHEQDP